MKLNIYKKISLLIFYDHSRQWDIFNNNVNSNVLLKKRSSVDIVIYYLVDIFTVELQLCARILKQSGAEWSGAELQKFCADWSGAPNFLCRLERSSKYFVRTGAELQIFCYNWSGAELHKLCASWSGAELQNFCANWIGAELQNVCANWSGAPKFLCELERSGAPKFFVSTGTKRSGPETKLTFLCTFPGFSIIGILGVWAAT